MSEFGQCAMGDLARCRAIARHMPSSRERLVVMKTPRIRWLARARRRNVTGRVSAPATLLAILLSLSALAPACAEVRIRASPGGDVKQYLALFAVVRKSGERVVIDGPCLSACTLVLSTIPHNRICVTPRAILGFHAARWVDRYGREYAAAEPTRAIAASYPASVRAWITRQGGLSRRVLLLRGRELRAMYPSCR
jgi:hypothetical protein